MMRTINDDILGYKNDFFKGLSFRETITGFLAVGIGAAIILYMVFGLEIQINIAITVGIPIIMLIGLIGFYRSKNGLTLLQLLSRKITMKKNGALTYRTTSLEKIGGIYYEQDGDKHDI